jgi:hypothetical protein
MTLAVSHLHANRVPLPISRLTSSHDARVKKNAPRAVVIWQQIHRREPAVQHCHCYFCNALDTYFEEHHHLLID